MSAAIEAQIRTLEAQIRTHAVLPPEGWVFRKAHKLGNDFAVCEAVVAALRARGCVRVAK